MCACFGLSVSAQESAPIAKGDLSDANEYEKQMEIGRRAIESGELEKAKKLFQEMSVKYPKDSKVLLCLARVHYHLSKREKLLLEWKNAELEKQNGDSARKLEIEIADLKREIAINVQTKSEIMARFMKTLTASDRKVFERIPAENDERNKWLMEKVPIDRPMPDAKEKDFYSPNDKTPHPLLQPHLPENAT